MATTEEACADTAQIVIALSADGALAMMGADMAQHRGYGRGYGYRRRGYGRGGAALGGLAAGAIIGGALAAQAAKGGGGGGPSRADVASCSRRFKSYDASSGTYLGYDGQRHACP